MSTNRKKKYKTEEEKHEADKLRKRIWARKNRKPNPTYNEMISKMTAEEYIAFLKRKVKYQQEYMLRKREQET